VAKKLEKLQDFRDWINQYLLKNLERFKQKFPAVRSFSSVRRILYLKKKNKFPSQHHTRPVTRGYKTKLVGGFNPFEKYESKWESSPIRSENSKNI